MVRRLSRVGAVRTAGVLGMAGLLVGLGVVRPGWVPGSLAPPDAAGQAVLAAHFGQLPLVFVSNAGQADPWAAYYAQGDTTSVLFGGGGLSFRQWRAPTHQACPEARGRGVCLEEWTAGAPPEPLAPLVVGHRAGDAVRGTVDAVGLTFVGGRPDVRPVAEDLAPTRYSYFQGRPEEWHVGLPTYGRLRYHDVWAGVDVVFEGESRRLKHTFVVAPGSDPAVIRMAWQGAAGLAVGRSGELVVDTPAGPLHDEAPVAYQWIDGRRVPVTVAYDVAPTTEPRTAEATERAYGFTVGAYDRTQALVIDPAVVVWAGFIGEGEFDRGLGIALGPDGGVHVTGQKGPSAFAAKFSADGRTLEWMSVIHGDGWDAAFDVDVDPRGATYLTGLTSSTSRFPLKKGPDSTFNGGYLDGFVVKLTPKGDGIDYAGYIGGAGTDFGEGVVVDAPGNAYLSGLAESTEATFPVKVGPDLTHNGGWDAYVLKLKPDPTAGVVEDNYVWAGFVGGDGNDVFAERPWLSSGHIGIDAAGNVYMSGQSSSTEATFPDGDGFGDLPGPDPTYNGGWYDAYIVKIRADGTGLAYAGYIGGDDYEEGKGMAVDASGAAYLTGATQSDEHSFPVKIGPDLTYNGGLDAFVAKVSPDGRSLEFCGYLGGDDDDQGQGVKLGPDGALYVAGRAESTEATFPVIVGPSLINAGPYDQSINTGDAFIGRLKSTIGAPDPRRNWDFMGFVGGSEMDGAYWLDVDGAGNAYIVGDTNSGPDSFPGGNGMGDLPTWQGSEGGAGDGFVARIDWTPPTLAGRRAFLPWAGRGVSSADLSTPEAVTLTPSSTPPATVTPMRSPTPTPTRQPTPVVNVPPGEELLYYDDFSDPHSGWQQGEDSATAMRYTHDQYEIEVDQATWIVTSFAPPRWFPRDGAIQVTVQPVNDDDAIFGLSFGPDQGPILYMINSRGGFQLMEIYGRLFRQLIPPSESPYLEQGTRPNELRIERNGRRVALFANGHLLASVANPVLAEPGRVGLVLGSFNGVPTFTRFDDLMVTRWAAGHATPTDLPPATAVPTPTEPPVGQVLLADDFSSPTSGWVTEDDANHSLGYDAGEYEVVVKREQYFAASAAPRVRCAECTIEADVHFVTTDLSLAMLVLGETDQKGLVFFEISNNGAYGVERHENGNLTTLLNPTSSGALKTGTQANHLRAVRRNGRLSVFANGTPLTTVDTPTLVGPAVTGIGAISLQHPVTARFDNFLVRQGAVDLAASLLAWPAEGQGPAGPAEPPWRRWEGAVPGHWAWDAESP